VGGRRDGTRGGRVCQFCCFSLSAKERAVAAVCTVAAASAADVVRRAGRTRAGLCEPEPLEGLIQVERDRGSEEGGDGEGVPVSGEVEGAGDGEGRRQRVGFYGAAVT
jgi:hypothetical protein